MTAAQLRNVTVKHDLHPDAPVFLDGEEGTECRPVGGFRVAKDRDGRTILILFTEESCTAPTRSSKASSEG